MNTAIKASLIWLSLTAVTLAQEESVRPGINDDFLNADPARYVERFEKEGREVYDQRNVIVAALDLKPGMVVADVGAGTGLFTRLIARQVGAEGRVYAVDIAPNFVYELVRDCRRQGFDNVIGVICDARQSTLPPNSVDLVYICDTYHHFEFPYSTLESIHTALREGGRMVVVDFEREEGVSSDWILNHVRAGKSVFRTEIEKAGFELVEEVDFLKDNYGLIFRKR
ncbi:MAG: methyltransferase domain-containing protein [Pirellulaceae bacterium]|nr:methyltransferase domain-containing protein [Pirellulaceae bacterium]